MTYKTKGINAEEIRFKLNPVKPSQNAFTAKPVFQRLVKTSNVSENDIMIVLTAKIESTENSPQVFDLFVSFVGCFEVFDATSNEEKELFLTSATRELYQYVRNAIISLTGAANVFSVVIPVNPPYFPLN